MSRSTIAFSQWSRGFCAIVDRMIVVDHLSADATPEILAALADEGLPLEIVRESRPDMAQSEVTSRWMRHAARERGADRVLPLDADEFLAVEGGDDVRSALVEGRCALRLNRYQAAIEPLETARRLDPGQKGVSVDLVTRMMRVMSPSHGVFSRAGRASKTSTMRLS